MEELAYVNGGFVPLESARISVQDRGLLFADGVYEVIVTYDGRPFRMGAHVDRLRRSLEAIRIDFDIASANVEGVVLEGVRRLGLDRAMVYLQITRGPADRAHPFPKIPKPTFFATFRASPTPSPGTQNTGIRLITTEDIRWSLCHIKSIALLPNVLAKQKALDAGAQDAIFVTPDGRVHEASASNVFMIAGGTLITAGKDQRILHGITRQFVIECAGRLDIPVRETAVSLDAFRSADEVFVTSTTSEIVGAVELDGNPIGDGTVGPITRKLHEQFLKGIVENLG